MKKLKSQLFSIAHSIKCAFNSFSEALKFAWKVVKLRKSLTTNNVRFSYKKIDGTIRHAVGTLNLDFESKSNRKPSFGLFTYFDIDKKSFRSCKVENLIF